MKKLRLLLALSVYLFSIGPVSCCQQVPRPGLEGVDAAASTAPNRVLITQQDLDEAVLVIAGSDTAILGNPFGVRTSRAEIESIRGMFASRSTNVAPLLPGTVLVIRSHLNQNGQRGRLRNVHVMVKRERSYNPEGGDFEYINIAFDPATDYALHPNGLLPALTDRANRGLDVASFGCVACHRRAGSRLLFTRPAAASERAK